MIRFFCMKKALNWKSATYESSDTVCLVKAVERLQAKIHRKYDFKCGISQTLE